MALPVYYLCLYYPSSAQAEGGAANNEQWNARKFSTCVKSRTVNGYLKYHSEHIDSSNAGRPRQIFGSFIASTLNEIQLNSAPIIPIPSKDGRVEATNFRTLSMIEECRAGRNWNIEPILRYSAELVPSSKGGPRGRAFTRENISLIRFPTSSPVVLVDDICTSGNTILGCYDVLASFGINVAAAIVCGSTSYDTTADPFIQSVRYLQTESTLALFDAKPSNV